MATFIKAGFWEKTCKPCDGYKGWLNLDQFVGQSGTSGTSGTSGPQGVQGIQGVQGPIGNTGATGTNGTNGTSGINGDRYQSTSTTTFTLGTSTTLTIGLGLAYSVAQDVLIAYNATNHQVSSIVSYNPLTGVLVVGPPTVVTGSGTYSVWSVNLNGASGGDGTNGTSGTSGLSGTSGTSGTSGVQGIQGIQGIQGVAGTNGTSGVNGTSGTSGITGSAGTSGTSGVLSSYYGSFIFDSDTTLTTTIPNPSSTATIQVANTTGFNSPGYFKIETEIIGYTGKTLTSFTGITRGVAGSVTSSHPAGVSISQAQATVANTPTQVLLDQTDLSNGVVLSGLGNVTVLNAGVYNLQFSIQIQNYSNTYEDSAVWFRVNGIDVPQSASFITSTQLHAGIPDATVLTVNIFKVLNANDVISLAWISKAGNTAITSVVSAPGLLPVSPGVIFTVNKIA